MNNKESAVQMAYQLEIPSVGQQKQSLYRWRKEHDMHTKRLWHGGWGARVGSIEAYASNERKAIYTLCKKLNLSPPSWW